MPREIIKHASGTGLKIDEARLKALASWLSIEITDALSSRSPLDSQWRENLRMYEGVPKNPVRDFPIPNAPNIEVTIGAIAADAITAQAIDLIFGTSPLVVCRPVPKRKNDEETGNDSKAMQRWVNWIATNEAKVRDAVEDAVLDDVQLGTGIFYIPFIEKRKNTKVAKIITRKPAIYCIPPEDCIVSGGSNGDVQELIMISLRFWYTRNQLEETAQQNNWNLEGVQAAGAEDWVRTRRETLGRQLKGIQRKGDLYDVHYVHCFYDIDGDGIDEDLSVIYNHSSQRVLKVNYNPCDSRPIVRMVYQRRAHLFYGLGVLEMMRPYQEETTDLHNYQVLNSLLANTRLWKATDAVPEGLEIWPNKVVHVREKDDLTSEQMADVYPSIVQLQALVMQLAERRVGVNEMSMPRTSQVMGSRTPGITALSMLQQMNKRFAPAFDGIRIAVAEALKQCVYRYQERVRAGNAWVVTHIKQTLGEGDGSRVIRLLRDETFDEHIAVELTAASAFSNKEADRQNAIMLVSVLGQYYQRTLELVTVAANPQVPEAVRNVAKQIASKAGEIIDRTIRTFDQVRDPAAFIIEVEDELDRMDTDQNAVQGLLGMFQGMQGGGALELPEMKG